MWQPSTTTGVCLRSLHHAGVRDYEEVVKQLYDAGYRVLDFAFVLHNSAGYILKEDDWQQRIDGVANLAAKLGVTFSQSHLPYVTDTQFNADASFKQPGYMDYFKECMRRSYIGSGMLGVRYATLHPISCPEFCYEEEATLKANHEFFDEFIELGIKHNVGTAYENMLPVLDRRYPARYCTHYEQLIRLVDSYNDPMVGICWDTGHANFMQFDQERALLAMGYRVKNLHINDNHNCNRDEHLQPFMGYINWESVMRGLAKIDYDGDLTYETNQVGIKAKGELQDAFVRLTYENGCYLRKLFDEERAKLGKE